jgi:hypothetical protein
VAQPPAREDEVVNVDTLQTESKPSNSVRGTALENYVLALQKKAYPRYAWYHQGIHKQSQIPHGSSPNLTGPSLARQAP